jgi:nucleoid-associated protein YgaU
MGGTRPDPLSIPVPITAGGGNATTAGQPHSIFGDAPTTQPSTPKPPTGGTTVKVQKGDTLSKLAAKYLGSANRWPELLKANESVLHGKATALGEGMTITIPAGSAPAATAAHTTPGTSTTPGHTTLTSTTTAAGKYTVQEGDTLSSIARKTLGDSSKWQLIFNANKSLLGNNPAHLKVGQTLTIPAAPTSTPVTPGHARHATAVATA